MDITARPSDEKDMDEAQGNATAKLFGFDASVRLTAMIGMNGWLVKDDFGGVWVPGMDAAAEIESSQDPRERALQICARTPMRGTWRL